MNEQILTKVLKLIKDNNIVAPITNHHWQVDIDDDTHLVSNYVNSGCIRVYFKGIEIACFGNKDGAEQIDRLLWTNYHANKETKAKTFGNEFLKGA